METLVKIQDVQDQLIVFGKHDSNIKYLRKICDVSISVVEDNILINGEEENVKLSQKILTELFSRAKHTPINKALIDLIKTLIEEDNLESFYEVTSLVTTTSKGKRICTKTVGQAQYVKAINNNSIVFGIGPAGTGKTYLAVALATLAFKNKQVDKIILTRPAVEAGEKLGFLPGDLGAKVDPYLRPLYDALQEMFGLDTYAKLIEKGAIEIAPLAYMRGRTLSNSFIILDEAQNTTKEQMKMFLTRMGEGSKIVVTGDTTQIDLPTDKASGLIHASKILQGIDDIAIINLTSKDVVRSELVQAIVSAYSDYEERKQKDKSKEK